MGEHDWTDVLKQITACIDAKSSMLRMVDYARSQIGFFDSVGIDPAYRQAYSRHYMNVDIYRILFETASVGVIMQSCQIPGYEQRHKTEFFNDYQKPQDMEYVCGSVLVRNDDLTVQFGAHRSKHASDFGQDEFSFSQTSIATSGTRCADTLAPDRSLPWAHPVGSKARCTACQWWKSAGSSRAARHFYSYRPHSPQGNLRQDGRQAAIRIGCPVVARDDSILPDR